MGARSGGRALLVALVAAAAVAVVGVLLSGPLQVSSSVWPGLSIPTPTHSPVSSTVPPAVRSVGKSAAHGVGTVILVILALVVAAVVTALVVWVVRRILSRREVLVPAGSVDVIDDATSALERTSVAAPAMRRGLARALELLDGPGRAEDAVVRAWQGLEEAARDAGTPRQPAETPSEYAARIVQRHDADRDAADALRRLYEGVRFGGARADGESVALARRCLTRLLESWSRAETAAAR